MQQQNFVICKFGTVFNVCVTSINDMAKLTDEVSSVTYIFHRCIPDNIATNIHNTINVQVLYL